MKGPAAQSSRRLGGGKEGSSSDSFRVSFSPAPRALPSRRRRRPGLSLAAVLAELRSERERLAR